MAEKVKFTIYIIPNNPCLEGGGGGIVITLSPALRIAAAGG